MSEQQQQAGGGITKSPQVSGTGHTIVIGDTHYHWNPNQPLDPALLAAARALLATLSTDTLPAHASPPPASRLPFGRDPNFIGREPDLHALARALTSGIAAAITPTAAATAPDGYGKTALAIEFVHRYGQFFAGGVFWLRAADASAIASEIAQCGGRGHMQLAPDFHTLPLSDQVGMVQRAWRSDLPRLIVCDNADSEASVAVLRELLPTSGGCRILITSRRASWAGVAVQPLGVLPRAESIALLQRLAPHLSAADADAIAAEVGDLPLALHLAGSYLAADPTTTGATYLAELRAAPLQHESLQGVDVRYSPTNHELHVWRTFTVSYDRLAPAEATDALALRLLQHASHFAPGIALPVELVTQSLALPEDTPARAPGRALRRLLDLGLLDGTPDAPVLHRLLAAFVQQAAPDDEAQAAVERVMRDVSYDLGKKGIPAPLLALQPHLRHITAVALVRGDEQAATLANNLGYHLNMIGDYAAARPLYARALAIREQVLGSDHPHTAQSLNNLALLLRATGDYAAARPLLERALAIREQVLGSDHPATASSLNNLALLLQATGDYAAARPLSARALAITEQVLGRDHPDTALSLNNLAGLLRATGDSAAARPLSARALAIAEPVLGRGTTATPPSAPFGSPLRRLLPAHDQREGDALHGYRSDRCGVGVRGAFAHRAAIGRSHHRDWLFEQRALGKARSRRGDNNPYRVGAHRCGLWDIQHKHELRVGGKLQPAQHRAVAVAVRLLHLNLHG